MHCTASQRPHATNIEFPGLSSDLSLIARKAAGPPSLPACMDGAEVRPRIHAAACDPQKPMPPSPFSHLSLALSPAPHLTKRSRPTAVNLRDAADTLSAAADAAASVQGATPASVVEAVVKAAEGYFEEDLRSNKVRAHVWSCLCKHVHSGCMQRAIQTHTWGCLCMHVHSDCMQRAIQTHMRAAAYASTFAVTACREQRAIQTHAWGCLCKHVDSDCMQRAILLASVAHPRVNHNTTMHLLFPQPTGNGCPTVPLPLRRCNSQSPANLMQWQIVCAHTAIHTRSLQTSTCPPTVPCPQSMGAHGAAASAAEV